MASRPNSQGGSEGSIFVSSRHQDDLSSRKQDFARAQQHSFSTLEVLPYVACNFRDGEGARRCARGAKTDPSNPKQLWTL
jgi:hypothetical protein